MLNGCPPPPALAELLEKADESTLQPYQIAIDLDIPIIRTDSISESYGMTDGRRIWIHRGLPLAVERETVAQLLSHISETAFISRAS
nr:MAG TPA: hypothetical protein [Caudoviricetes sp.]